MSVGNGLNLLNGAVLQPPLNRVVQAGTGEGVLGLECEPGMAS